MHEYALLCSVTEYSKGILPDVLEIPENTVFPQTLPKETMSLALVKASEHFKILINMTKCEHKIPS
jgi:hypothetical protein